ncbi:MAG TPA: elongation factor Ts [Chloroflexia bacterium]|nr:elongation factor Ts [Chloroflexia bacterium]
MISTNPPTGDDWWRDLERGQAAGARYRTRPTPTGIIASYIHIGGRIGAMVELRCETEFVAATADFQGLAHDLALQVAAMAPRYVRRDAAPAGVDEEQVLLEQAFVKDPRRSVEELILEFIARFGEHIQVARFVRFEVGTGPPTGSPAPGG